MKTIVFAEMAARPESGAGEQQKTGTLAFSRIMAADDKVGVATISGYIGYGSATVEEFNKNLEELKTEGCTKLEVVMNSMGGNLFEASGIYDLIKGCGMEVTAKIYGVAASAATLISCAASRVLISENSRYMVHRAQGFVMGNVDEIGGYLADLKSTEDQILGIYAARTGKGAEDVMNILKAETWMNAETAVAEGWCDEVISTSAEEPGKETAKDQQEEKGGESPDPEDSGKKGAPSNAVLRRMMQAVGITTADNVEALEREVSRLVAENERLLAENDGFRGMQAEQARLMAAHEEELGRRVQEGVVKEMAVMGVPPASLPPAEPDPGNEGTAPPAMTNEKLAEMSAQDAVAWIRAHPKEAAKLAEQA